MTSLKNVLESTLAEARFDLGESEATNHGPSMVYRGNREKVVSADELHRLVTADRWEDELAAQARNAVVIASDEAMSPLYACLNTLLGEHIDPESNCIGHAFPMSSANRSSTSYEVGGVAPQSYSSPMEKFAKLLIRGCAVIGTESLAEFLTAWAKGSPVRYRTSAMLNGLYLNSGSEPLPGIRLDPFPTSTDILPGTAPIPPGRTAKELLGRTVLSVDSIATPAFFRPKRDSLRLEVEAGFTTDVALDDICHALALESDGNVWTAFEWNDYGELSHCLSPGNSSIRNTSREGLDALPLGHSVSGAFGTGIHSVSIPENHISKLSADRVGALIQSISGKESSLFRVALSRWCKSKKSFASISDQFIDLRVALESLYLKKFKGEQSGEMTFRLALFGAWHLGEGMEERKQIRRTLLDTYNIGSRAVHGQELKFNDKNLRLLSEGQRLCRLGILKVLEEGEPDDWEDLILGD